MAAIQMPDYTRSELDAHYDNRAKVADFPAHLAQWARSSEEVCSQFESHRDLRYGDGPEDTLDIYPAARGGAPIQVFYHGGYWKALSKNQFAFVARGFRPHGMVTVVVEYSLIPTVRMGALVQQCRDALAWIWRHAAEFGGDPGRLYISGHSAGGHLVGMLCATQWQQESADLPAAMIRGATSLSGLMDLAPIRRCFLNEALSLSEAEVAAYSPARLAHAHAAPLALMVGAAEGPEYLRQSEVLARHWSQSDPAPQVRVLDGEDHFSIVSQLERPDSTVAEAIAAQVGTG